MKENVAIILVSEVGLPLAQTIRRELGASSAIYTMHTLEGCENISSYSGFMSDRFHDFGAFVFIGALGICVRSMATCLKNKYTDPAVVCTDSAGRFVVSVLSGHIGGANDWTRRINDFLLIRQCLQEGMGVGLLPDFFVTPADGLKPVALHGSTPEVLEETLYLVMHEDVRRSPAVRAVADFLLQVLAA